MAAGNVWTFFDFLCHSWNKCLVQTPCTLHLNLIIYRGCMMVMQLTWTMEAFTWYKFLMTLSRAHHMSMYDDSLIVPVTGP